MSEVTPLSILQGISDQARLLAAQNVGLVAQSAGVKNIAFLINNVRFCCAADEVREVSTCENLMPVPQTKRWMRGLVNSKGVLYSVTDLSLLAGFERITNTNTGHLLITNDERNQSALLVTRVIGFRFFDEDKQISDLSDSQESLDGLSSFVSSGFEIEGHKWYRLDVAKLLASEQFREVQ